MSQTISAGRTPKIEIETIDGDLSLVGWEGDDILLKADDDEIDVYKRQVSMRCAPLIRRPRCMYHKVTPDECFNLNHNMGYRGRQASSGRRSGGVGRRNNGVRMHHL